VGKSPKGARVATAQKSLLEFFEEKSLARAAVAKEMGRDPSLIGKWMNHSRRFPLERMVEMWIALKKLGVKVRFGKFCEMAANGLEAFDAESQD